LVGLHEVGAYKRIAKDKHMRGSEFQALVCGGFGVVYFRDQVDAHSLYGRSKFSQRFSHTVGARFCDKLRRLGRLCYTCTSSAEQKEKGECKVLHLFKI